MQHTTPTPEAIALAIKQQAETIYAGDFSFPENFSLAEQLTQALQLEYPILCQTFLAKENITLEKYIENLRIEKIKELLVYSNDTLPQIAAKLGFLHARQMAAHFKAHTGLNTGYFKEIRKSRLSIKDMPGKPS